jgi:transposase InsO family protein
MKTLLAEEVADLIYKLIITRHGCPTKLLTDQGKQFVSELLKYFCSKFNIHKLQASTKHPQCNSKAERFIRFLTNGLSLIISEDQSDWDESIDTCLLAYRTTICEKISETPFFLLYGRDPVLPGDLLFNPPVDSEISIDVNNPIEQLDYKLQLINKLKHAYDNIALKRDKAINYYKYRYDNMHRDIKFKPNDLVMVYWPIPKQGYSQKLLPKWKGPYRIITNLGPVTYRVELNNKRHPHTIVVHVQRLRSYQEWLPKTADSSISKLEEVNSNHSHQ